MLTFTITEAEYNSIINLMIWSTSRITTADEREYEILPSPQQIDLLNSLGRQKREQEAQVAS